MVDILCCVSDETLAIDTALVAQFAITVFGGLLGYDIVGAAVVGFVAYWPILFGTLFVLRRT